LSTVYPQTAISLWLHFGGFQHDNVFMFWKIYMFIWIKCYRCGKPGHKTKECRGQNYAQVIITTSKIVKNVILIYKRCKFKLFNIFKWYKI
jgi:hypothetical protein